MRAGLLRQSLQLWSDGRKTAASQGCPFSLMQGFEPPARLPGGEHRFDMSAVRRLRRLEMCLRHPADPKLIPEQVYPTYSVSPPRWYNRDAKIPLSARSTYICNLSPCAVVPLGVGASFINEMLWETKRDTGRGNPCQPLWWLGDVGRRCLETALGTPHWDSHGSSVTGNHLLN